MSVSKEGIRGLDELPQRILSSNVVFEAFGNAATTNNPNSSRFGKFVRLIFDQQGRVCGARALRPCPGATGSAHTAQTCAQATRRQRKASCCALSFVSHLSRYRPPVAAPPASA